MELKRLLMPDQIDDLADEIYKMFRDNGMWSDTCIYFNAKSLDNKDHDGKHQYDGRCFIHDDVWPEDYFEYVNPEHILSMSFEGPVYHMFNYNEHQSVLKQFNELLEKYGLYYELGDAWNLTCYYT